MTLAASRPCRNPDGDSRNDSLSEYERWGRVVVELVATENEAQLDCFVGQERAQ